MVEALNTHLVGGEYGLFEGDSGDQVVLSRYAATGTWSPELVRLLARKLAHGGTLIDVGAHIGLVSIPVAARSQASCIAFEPAPINAECLERNVARHGLDARVEVHALALSHERGTLRFALHPDNSGDHHVCSEHAALPAGFREARVRTERLDDLLGDRVLARPAFLKLDTQGSEARVLMGAQRVLEQVDALVLEYWPAGLARLGDRASMLSTLLTRFPFAAVLRQDEAPFALIARDEALRSLSWIAEDGSDEGFFDVLLTVEPDFLPRGFETHAPR